MDGERRRVGGESRASLFVTGDDDDSWRRAFAESRREDEWANRADSTSPDRAKLVRTSPTCASGDHIAKPTHESLS